MINILSVFITLFLAFSTKASDKDNHFKKSYYVSVFVGTSEAGRVGGSFPATHLSKTNTFGTAVGKQFNDHIRSDLSLESRKNYKLNYSEDDLKILSKYQHNMKVNSLSLMLNLYYDIIKYNKFIPYLVFGIGPTYNTVKKNNILSIDEEQNVTNNVSISNGYKTSLGYKLGLGTNYEINNYFNFNLQYQFINLGGFRTGNIAADLEGCIHKPSAKGTLKARELLFSAAYKF